MKVVRHAKTNPTLKILTSSTQNKDLDHTGGSCSCFRIFVLSVIQYMTDEGPCVRNVLFMISLKNC